MSNIEEGPKGTPLRNKARGAAVIVAGLAAVLTWLIARYLFDVPFLVPSGGDINNMEQVSVVVTLGFAVVMSLLGWGLLAVLERYLKRAATIWTVIAVLIAFLSLLPPLTLENTTKGTRIALAAMHIVVAAIVIPVFRRTSPRS